MDDGVDTRHAALDEIHVVDRADTIGKRRGFDIDPARRSAIGAKAPHQGFAQMSAAAGD
jgi:hypothetical protein